MSSTPDVGPTRVARPLIAACAAGPLLACAWALWPLPEIDVEVPAARPGAPPGTDREPASIDLAAFSAPVWVAVPVPDPPAEPQPASLAPPLRLQLLAIVHEGDALRAMLYDEAADRIRVVGEGDTLGEGRSVETVRGRQVRIIDGGQVRTLALQEPGR